MELTPQVEEHTIKVDGRRVYYTARGPMNAEYAYVGVNGLMGSGDSFWPVIESVPGSWRVVLPDLPGCGGSEPILPPHKHDVVGYSDWLGRFLEAVGLVDRKLVLVSVASGAPVSIHYAWTHQEQVVGQVMHLPFLGKPGISAKWVRPLIAYALLTPPLRKLAGKVRGSDALMHRIIFHKPPEAIPELAERDIGHKRQADLVAAGQLLHDMMLTDARAMLRHLRQPVLILASEHDPLAPLPVLEEIVFNHEERRLYVYRGGKHSWNEEFILEMNVEIGEFLRFDNPPAL